jgi:hypothetical protein
MGFVGGIWIIVLGILGAASLIIARKPDAKQLIDKLTPYQGWIGAVSALWGVWELIGALLTLNWLGHCLKLLWITYLAVAVIHLSLGLLLGVGVFKTFIKDPTANEKMDKTISKLAPYQGTLGLIAIGLGVWMILANIFWNPVTGLC